MRIVITHLTRMGTNLICVAGIDLDTGKHVRPLTNRLLRLSHCKPLGGVFSIGEIVDLGRTRPKGTPPEVEDQEFREHQLSTIGRIDPARLWEMLSDHADTRLQRIFGRDLEKIGTSCATMQGRGIASLGCLIPTRIIDLSVRRYPGDFVPREALRILLQIGDHEFSLPVTDLRFSKLHPSGSRWLFHRDLVDDVNARIADGVPVILSVGLSRPFQRNGTDGARHWLQVNNIHLKDDPLWGLDSLTLLHPDDAHPQ
jgi:hypothetical protein